MTIVPFMCTPWSASRIAFPAVERMPSRSRLPIQRPAERAAASVGRTSSSPRFGCTARGGRDEVPKEWMWTVRSRAEFRVELRGNEPRVVTQLDDFHQTVVGRCAREDHARLPHRLTVGVVELEAMPVSFVHDRLAIGLRRQRAGLQLAGVEAETHGAALIGDVALLGQEVDDRMAGEGVELGAVGVRVTELVAAELDDGAVHPEAETQVRRQRGPGESGRGNLPLDAAMTEPARNHDAVDIVERPQIAGLERVGRDPFDVDPQIVVHARVPQGFGDTDVGIGRRQILSHYPDADAASRMLDAMDQLFSVG